jgi:hypothetical protein
MLQMMELLLKHKANVYLTDAVGNTALHALGTVCYFSSSSYVHVKLSVLLWMTPSRVVRASDCQCRSRNRPVFDPSFLRHIWGGR